MPQLSPAQAEEVLTHLTQHFARWRQSRCSPRGRIPQELWAQAVALTTTLSVTRVAHQLGLTPHALKKVPFRQSWLTLLYLVYFGAP
jgi:hypothetical protein